MLLTAVALLSRFNASRIGAGGTSYKVTTSYQKCGTSFFMESDVNWSDSGLGTCYYLDYSSSVTLTVDGSEYTNPIFFCPGGASEIKFEPDDGIYCAEFDLTSVVTPNLLCETYTSIYVTTESTSFETPVTSKQACDELLLYYDLVLAPLPSGTISYGDSLTEEVMYGLYNILALSSTEKESSTVTVSVNSGANYTIKRSINKRYSINIPFIGPYVFNGESSGSSGSSESGESSASSASSESSGSSKSSKSGLSVGAVSGIAVVAVAVVGAAVGVSVYFILKNRKKDKGDEPSSSSS